MTISIGKDVFGFVFAGAIGMAVTAGIVPDKAVAEGPSLEGAWSGGGRIVFPSGESERARCRASFRRQGGESFGMSAVCATPSTRVQQSAEITRVSANRYRGEFFNAEFGLSGSIRIIVNGDSMDASLSGGGGSAEFNLSR
jgi:hypothetical protein